MTATHHNRMAPLIALSLALLAPSVSLAQGTQFAIDPDTRGELYYGFTLVDPDAKRLQEDSWLIVRVGKISAIGSGERPSGDFAAEHDMGGTYAMAGLIDAHGHITAGPMRITPSEGSMKIEITSGDEFSRSNAAIALASGVTTVRNPASSTEAAARYDSMVASGAWIGPEALHAGAVHERPPYTGESFVYPQSAAEWDADAAAQAAAGMTYYKLYAGLSEEELASGVTAAKAHGLIPIAHLNDVSWTRAVELGVEQLEHALPTSPTLLEPAFRGEYAFGPDYITRWWELADLEGPLMDKLIDTLAREEIEVNLTLLVNEMIYFADELDTRFPELVEQPDYMHPDLAASVAPSYQAMAAMPSDLLDRGKAVWPKVLSFARMLYDAGVPLMIGTDGTGGGVTYARELSHHVTAGIPIWEVLRMATSGNAKLMDLHHTGRVLPGMEADLVFLNANPVEDVTNVRQVALVVSNGEPNRPDELLDVARAIAAAASARDRQP